MVRILIILTVNCLILSLYENGTASEKMNFRIECNDLLQTRWAYEYNNNKYPMIFKIGLATNDYDHLGMYDLVEMGSFTLKDERFFEVHFNSVTIDSDTFPSKEKKIGHTMNKILYSIDRKHLYHYYVQLNEDKTQILGTRSSYHTNCISIGL
ncbi:hypothetical protein JWG42_14335 [Desulfoprunum benzoelyticum]|nr:hypothetical protein [Desulfoprunum benzoelyticum]